MLTLARRVIPSELAVLHQQAEQAPAQIVLGPTTIVAVKTQCVTDLCIGDAGRVGLRQLEHSVFNKVPGLRAEVLATMEWSMIISFAGPFAEAHSRNYRSRRGKRWAALFWCGASEDYAQAEPVLADYKKASKRRYGFRHFEDRAWELVAANQPAISALASKLLQHETLEYKEAHKIAAPLLGP